ncbi:MAG: mannonate dehydratase [Opitutaceae bacterium]|nr:mannonate dehydratase [Opitutaceae bacterium]
MPAPLMEEAMRWFGPADTVTLEEIRQTGATAVFSALHEVPYGQVWPMESILQRRAQIEAAGLRWTAVESVPVHESIKTRTEGCSEAIAAYQETLRRLGAAGLQTVIYNFMPVLDWVRTDLHYRLADGAEALLYDPVKFAAFDLFALGRKGAEADFPPPVRAAAARYWADLGVAGQQAFTRQTLDLFPGVKLNVSLDDLRAMLARYGTISAAQLREHLGHFLQAIAPVAQASGVRLAIHPDDPPFPVLGLPRIVSTESDLRAVLDLDPSPANGICYCTGSLGARGDNDLPGIVHRLGSRIHAAHLRNVQREPNGVFFEAAHLGGSTNMAAVVHALLQEQQSRRAAGRADATFAFRPDHGHRMLDDFRRPDPTCPGYPLIGRLRGLAELRGLQHGLAHLLGR